MGFASISPAATVEADATYNAANEKTAANYKIATETCKPLTGHPKDVCMAEAKNARTRTHSRALARYKRTPGAHANARITIANSDYALARTKCGSQYGNKKNLCLKEAQATKVAAKANAKPTKR